MVKKVCDVAGFVFLPPLSPWVDRKGLFRDKVF